MKKKMFDLTRWKFQSTLTMKLTVILKAVKLMKYMKSLRN